MRIDLYKHHLFLFTYMYNDNTTSNTRGPQQDPPTKITKQKQTHAQNIMKQQTRNDKKHVHIQTQTKTQQQPQYLRDGQIKQNKNAKHNKQNKKHNTHTETHNK